MAMKQSLIVFGGGNHAAAVADAARSAGYVVLGFLDDADDSQCLCALLGMNRLGAVAELPNVINVHRHANFHPASRDPDTRKLWLDMMKGLLVPAILHPSAVVSPSARLGEGVFVGPQAVVSAKVTLGPGVIVSTGAVVEPCCTLEAFCSIDSCSLLAEGVTVREMARIGSVVRIGPGVTIGARATLGPGAVVIEDVSEDSTVPGSPANAMHTT